MNFEKYHNLQQETIVDGLKVSYVVQGTGMSLLRIHGIPVWGYLWKYCVAALAERFQIITPDLVGYGDSDRQDRFDRSIKVQPHLL